jgi:phytanoyl-CoA hydroxylase
MAVIDAAAKQRYESDGYLVVPGVLSRREIDVLRGVVDRFIDQSRSITESTEVIEIAPGHTAQDPRVRRITWPHLRAPEFHALLRHPVVLDVVSSLIGPDLRFHHTKLTLKLARHGDPVEWHQDWAFYPHTNEDVLEVGLCIDDVTMDNGPLMVVPGSHRGPIYDHHVGGVFYGAVGADQLRTIEAQMVPMLGAAGSMTVHHVRMLHGSGPNLSDRPRRYYLMGYSAADAWPLTPVPLMDGGTYLDGALVAGRSTLQPRMEQLPVRLPFPIATRGSIYDTQREHPDRRYATVAG